MSAWAVLTQPLQSRTHAGAHEDVLEQHWSLPTRPHHDRWRVGEQSTCVFYKFSKSCGSMQHIQSWIRMFTRSTQPEQFWHSLSLIPHCSFASWTRRPTFWPNTVCKGRLLDLRGSPFNPLVLFKKSCMQDLESGSSQSTLLRGHLCLQSNCH